MIRKLPLFMLVIFVTFLASACSLLREPEEASGPIEAIPLQVETDTPSQESAAPDGEEIDEPQESGAEAYPPPAQVDGPEQEDPEAYPPADGENEPGASNVEEAYPDAEAPVDDDAVAGSQLRVYRISQQDSRVTFELDEDLRGERATVVGATNQVAGELALNLADLSTAQIGVIQINARTLLTDNNFRNRAIQNEILETGAYEFITFTPTAILDLPASATVGDEVNFTVEGDLTIRDITQPVSFNVVAAAVSETELSGRATTAIERESFALTIPQVRNVANVEEVVALTIEFVSRAG